MRIAVLMVLGQLLGRYRITTPIKTITKRRPGRPSERLARVTLTLHRSRFSVYGEERGGM